jgi:hypothetical protein
MSSRSVAAILLFALLGISELDADDRPQPGAVEQHGGPVSQDVKLPPLELTNAQRELVRKEKENDSAASFTPEPAPARNVT